MPFDRHKSSTLLPLPRAEVLVFVCQLNQGNNMPSITNISDTQLTVSYPAGEAQQVITKAEYALIRDMTNDRTKAVKFIRAQYSHSLYAAKQIVDTIQNHKEY
jgi:hypothetical protein